MGLAHGLKAGDQVLQGVEHGRAGVQVVIVAQVDGALDLAGVLGFQGAHHGHAGGDAVQPALAKGGHALHGLGEVLVEVGHVGGKGIVLGEVQQQHAGLDGLLEVVAGVAEDDHVAQTAGGGHGLELGVAVAVVGDEVERHVPAVLDELAEPAGMFAGGATAHVKQVHGDGLGKVQGILFRRGVPLGGVRLFAWLGSARRLGSFAALAAAKGQGQHQGQRQA